MINTYILNISISLLLIIGLTNNVHASATKHLSLTPSSENKAELLPLQALGYKPTSASKVRVVFYNKSLWAIPPIALWINNEPFVILKGLHYVVAELPEGKHKLKMQDFRDENDVITAEKTIHVEGDEVFVNISLVPPQKLNAEITNMTLQNCDCNQGFYSKKDLEFEVLLDINP